MQIKIDKVFKKGDKIWQKVEKIMIIFLEGI